MTFKKTPAGEGRRKMNTQNVFGGEKNGKRRNHDFRETFFFFFSPRLLPNYDTSKNQAGKLPFPYHLIIEVTSTTACFPENDILAAACHLGNVDNKCTVK